MVLQSLKSNLQKVVKYLAFVILKKLENYV